MRSKVSDDGKRRILAKVEVAVDTDKILRYALVHPMFSDSNTKLDDFEKLNKRQIFKCAKESIGMFGSKILEQSVPPMWSSRQVDRARQHVRRLFPEVD